MKDAFGGIVNVFLVAVFLVIVEGILGLVVNYSKAFRMKNEVISAIERYEGLGCFNNSSSDCRQLVRNKAKSIGYSPPGTLRCPQGFVSIDSLYCCKSSDSSSKDYYIYSVVTQVDINIPIINKIMGLSFFQIHGDTRVVKKYNTNQVGG